MKVQAKPEQAKRLMRALDLPRQAPKVLTEARFWSEAFCRLYFERCEETLDEDPQTGLEMARVGKTLASRVAEEHCTGRLPDLSARAQGLTAAAHRALGDLKQADRLYREALGLDGVSTGEQAYLKMCLAVLRLHQQRRTEALDLSTETVSAHRRKNDRRRLGIALSVHGFIEMEMGQLPEAIRHLTEAIELIPPKKNRRAYGSTVFNLAVCLCHCDELLELSSTLHRLNRARRLIRAERGSLPRLWLRWLEGLIQGRLGLHGRAMLDLRAARDGFLELGLPFETAMVSLDLSLVYAREGLWQLLRDLAAETFTVLRGLGIDREATAALKLWTEAVRQGELGREVVATVRERLSQNRGESPHSKE